MEAYLDYDTHIRVVKAVKTPEQVARIARLCDYFLTKWVELGAENELYQQRYNATLDLFLKTFDEVGGKAINEWLDSSAENNAFKIYMCNIKPNTRILETFRWNSKK